LGKILNSHGYRAVTRKAITTTTNPLALQTAVTSPASKSPGPSYPLTSPREDRRRTKDLTPPSAAPNKSSNPSKGSIVKDGWGSRSNFQASYGLDMTPEGLEEGETILNAMQDADKGGRK
jgi:hypothetical protein